jgi:hypothetical protein
VSSAGPSRNVRVDDMEEGFDGSMSQSPKKRTKYDKGGDVERRASPTNTSMSPLRDTTRSRIPSGLDLLTAAVPSFDHLESSKYDQHGKSIFMSLSDMLRPQSSRSS